MGHTLRGRKGNLLGLSEALWDWLRGVSDLHPTFPLDGWRGGQSPKGGDLVVEAAWQRRRELYCLLSCLLFVVSPHVFPSVCSPLCFSIGGDGRYRSSRRTGVREHGPKVVRRTSHRQQDHLTLLNE
ncbi:hypothetical protein FKM82_025176 [Ascaphus truei]